MNSGPWPSLNSSFELALTLSNHFFQHNCSLTLSTYMYAYSPGWYPLAVMVEDFGYHSYPYYGNMRISSIPLQFTIEIYSELKSIFNLMPLHWFSVHSLITFHLFSFDRICTWQPISFIRTAFEGAMLKNCIHLTIRSMFKLNNLFLAFLNIRHTTSIQLLPGLNIQYTTERYIPALLNI